MCCCGLNTILNLPANIGDKTDGAAVDVSGLQGTITVEISGSYQGTYSILGSHDGNLYFPVAYFDSGASSQSVRKTLDVVARFLKVHREAPRSGLVTVNIAGRATTACATSGQSGLNNFFTLATIPKGATGPQPVLDLFSLVASTGVDVSNVACGGSFHGQISVEGSLDGINFSPLCGFAPSRAQRDVGTGQLTFDPVVIQEIIRYVRANVLPGTVIVGPTSFTFGGPQNCDCGASCAPIGLGSSGSFEFTESDFTPIILATFSYNFSCSNKANVQLFGTVDSKSLSETGNVVFPDYGIFIATVVPPASELFSLISPDVELTTVPPADLLFHTYTDNNTIANPGGVRFVIFAVRGDTTNSGTEYPAAYLYQNFILDVTGV